MENLWKIYYDHWGKDQHELRKKIFHLKSIDQSLIHIFACFYFSDYLDLKEWKSCPKTRNELIQSIEFTLSFLKYPKQKMNFMLEMSHIFLKDEIPLKYLKEVENPTERRFWKNIGYNDIIFSQSLNTQQAHQLDALLAFF